MIKTSTVRDDLSPVEAQSDLFFLQSILIFPHFRNDEAKDHYINCKQSGDGIEARAQNFLNRKYCFIFDFSRHSQTDSRINYNTFNDP